MLTEFRWVDFCGETQDNQVGFWERLIKTFLPHTLTIERGMDHDQTLITPTLRQHCAESFNGTLTREQESPKNECWVEMVLWLPKDVWWIIMEKFAILVHYNYISDYTPHNKRYQCQEPTGRFLSAPIPNVYKSELEHHQLFPPADYYYYCHYDKMVVPSSSFGSYYNDPGSFYTGFYGGKSTKFGNLSGVGIWTHVEKLSVSTGSKPHCVLVRSKEGPQTAFWFKEIITNGGAVKIYPHEHQLAMDKEDIELKYDSVTHAPVLTHNQRLICNYLRALGGCASRDGNWHVIPEYRCWLDFGCPCQSLDDRKKSVSSFMDLVFKRKRVKCPGVRTWKLLWMVVVTAFGAWS